MPHLPLEIWMKIWTLTAIVDKQRKLLLEDIRKYPILLYIENVYSNHWGNFENESNSWLHNDIVGWLNQGRGTLWSIEPKLKEYCLRNFNINITNNDDLDTMEQQLLLKYKPTKHNLWKIYSSALTEQESKQFQDWVVKRSPIFINSIF